MRYIEKLSALSYYLVIAAMILIGLIIMICVISILTTTISMNRKIKWLEKNGFVRGVVDFGNNAGYKKENICFTDKEIQKYSLSEIKALTIMKDKNII